MNTIREQNERIKNSLKISLNNILTFNDYITINNYDLDLNIKNFFDSLLENNNEYLCINKNIINWLDYECNIKEFMDILDINGIVYFKLEELTNNIKVIGDNVELLENKYYVIVHNEEFKKLALNIDSYKGNCVRIYYDKLIKVLYEYNDYVNEYKYRQKKLKRKYFCI